MSTFDHDEHNALNAREQQLYKLYSKGLNLPYEVAATTTKRDSPTMTKTSPTIPTDMNSPADGDEEGPNPFILYRRAVSALSITQAQDSPEMDDVTWTKRVLELQLATRRNELATTSASFDETIATINLWLSIEIKQHARRSIRASKRGLKGEKCRSSIKALERQLDEETIKWQRIVANIGSEITMLEGQLSNAQGL